MNLISIKMAAEIRGVSPQTIRYWIKTGKIKTVMTNPHIVRLKDIESIVLKATGRPRKETR